MEIMKHYQWLSLKEDKEEIKFEADGLLPREAFQKSLKRSKNCNASYSS